MNHTHIAAQSISDRRLKVLFLTTWYPDPTNPVSGIFVREHARAVSRKDDVVVLHLKGNEPGIHGLWKMEAETDETLHQGIRTYRVSHRLSQIPNTSLLIQIYSVFQALNHLNRIGYRPDVLHAHIYKAGLPAVLIGRVRHIPVIVSEQNSAFPRKLLSKRDIFLARYALSRASMVLPVSAALQTGIQSYGIRANFRLVPNVADTAIFTPKNLPPSSREIKKFLFVGRLDAIKGLPYLFQALYNIHQQRDNWSLDIVGDGPERASYENMVVMHGIEKHIKFHGSKSKFDIARLMQDSDLFVLPSLWDNMPCVLLEAMASGLPILSTQTGGIPEIVDGETGILVPPGDSEALTRALGEILEGGILHYRRNDIAKKAQRYSPQAVGDLLHSIYQEAAHDHEARTPSPGSRQRL